MDSCRSENKNTFLTDLINVIKPDNVMLPALGRYLTRHIPNKSVQFLIARLPAVGELAGKRGVAKVCASFVRLDL